MKHTRIFTALLGALALMATSCGTSDYLESLQLSSSSASSGSVYNLAGVDGTVQLQVFAVYHSGKMIDVTTSSTWTVTPVCCDQDGNALPPYGPTTVPINKTGLMTGILSACTWKDAVDNTKSPPAPANPPIWEYTGYYQTTATYRNFTSQPVGIGVGSVASKNSPIGGCGPS